MCRVSREGGDPGAPCFRINPFHKTKCNQNLPLCPSNQRESSEIVRRVWWITGSSPHTCTRTLSRDDRLKPRSWEHNEWLLALKCRRSPFRLLAWPWAAEVLNVTSISWSRIGWRWFFLLFSTLGSLFIRSPDNNLPATNMLFYWFQAISVNAQVCCVTGSFFFLFF